MMDLSYNLIPGINSYQENMNPIISSPNSEYAIPFYQTRDSLTDVDGYRQFLKNVESRFRKSETYKNYKSFFIVFSFIQF